MLTRLVFVAALTALALPAQKYRGPQPEKADLLYLVHGDNLVATDEVEAKEEQRKDLIIYTVQGASSTAKTPLSGPILMVKADKLIPEKLALYRFTSKGGVREVTFNKKKPKDNRPIRFSIDRIAEGLFKLEVSESLENGEYGFSPEGSNQVFCFQVY